ncbi:MAG: hypothetical protein ACF8TS_05270, partial [Maioricimonas sp. JB049]
VEDRGLCPDQTESPVRILSRAVTHLNGFEHFGTWAIRAFLVCQEAEDAAPTAAISNVNPFHRIKLRILCEASPDVHFL